MRRIILNSTAALAIFALVAPDIARAQAAGGDPGGPAASELEAMLQNALGAGEPAGALSLATGDLAQERAARLPGLAHVLAQEVGAGLQMSQLECLAGGSAPCADGGPMLTPRGVVVHTNQQGQLVLSPVERQLHRVNADGEIVRRTAPEEQPAPESAPLTVATGELAQQRAEALPGLAAVLAREVEGGLHMSQLDCLAGGSAPCAEGGPMVTPMGVVVHTNQQGQLVLSPVERQLNRVNAQGEIVRRAAEEGVPDTQAAIEAAQAENAPDAAALAATAETGTARVIEQTITADDRRSSSDDFVTSLSEALSGQGQPAARADDGNDLARALVLGLGALAVGSALNNNRKVALSTPDRVVVTRADGSQEVVKDETALLLQEGAEVVTEYFDDGSSRTVVERPDGSRIVSIRDADLRILRRTLISADGQSTPLIDDTVDVRPVDTARLPDPAPVQPGTSQLDEDALAEALRREAAIDRTFTLGQIRNIPEVRALVPPINIDAITFDTGSAAIRPDQARELATLGRVIQQAIAENPREIFLIEGHTDTVGSDAMNLALSDRRAESVALALTEYFDVPPENLVVQGYGEQFLYIRAEGDIRENRRASVRRITDLLHGG